jgi:outer membrane protein OmpA-like peptidoglycan-associated protein
MNRNRHEEPPTRAPARLARLGRALAAAACLAVLLGGCQTPAPQPPADRTATLRALGFAETEEGWTLSLAVPILFDVDSDELKPEPRRAIAEMARALRKVGIERIRVEGHTDNFGGREYNIELSRRRAEVVARAFVEAGFPDAGIDRKAWGFAHPAAPNDSAEGRALNRRVAIVVVAAGPAAD